MLVSHLRRPTPEKASASDQEKLEEGQQTKNESQESAGMVLETETAGESSSGTGNDDQVPPSIPLNGSRGTPAVDDESQGGTNATLGRAHDMQFESNDSGVRDVEAR
ncbi:unnamed protein product [Lactuca virosa]|uniref:Uncharacterized protein n=1 Tax=Lactuca virosa TaxID=75947 RepID=A0AAU9LG95_9ASTR|nr:unnamed protein product [Lactuca virosa]